MGKHQTIAELTAQLAELPDFQLLNSEQKKIYQKIHTELTRRRQNPEKYLSKVKNIEAEQSEKQRKSVNDAEKEQQFIQSERRWFLEYQLSGKSQEENPNDSEMNDFLIPEILEYLAEYHIPSRNFERDYVLLNVLHPVGTLILSFLGLPLLDTENCYVYDNELRQMPKNEISADTIVQGTADEDERQSAQHAHELSVIIARAEQAEKESKHKAEMKQLENRFKAALKQMRQYTGAPDD